MVHTKDAIDGAIVVAVAIECGDTKNVATELGVATLIMIVANFVDSSENM